MAKKSHRPNILIDRLPPAKRTRIKAVCARYGTSIEHIPAWMLGLPPQKIGYRLRLLSESRLEVRKAAGLPAQGTANSPGPALKPGPSGSKPRPGPSSSGPQPGPDKKLKAKSVKKKKKKKMPTTETGRIKVPNTLTGTEATWYLKNIVSRVGNQAKKRTMQRLIFENLDLPLDEFRKTVLARIDEMCADKKKPEETQ